MGRMSLSTSNPPPPHRRGDSHDPRVQRPGRVQRRRDPRVRRGVLPLRPARRRGVRIRPGGRAPGGQGQPGDRRRLRPLPVLQRRAGHRICRRRRARRHVRLAVGRAGVPDRAGGPRRRRCGARLRQLRRGPAQLQGGGRPADRRGHRRPHRVRDRRHRLGRSRRGRQAAGHRRNLHRLQDRRGGGGGRRRPGRGGTADAGGQRGDVLLRGGVRRLHDAGLGRAAVQCRARPDGLRAGHPR